MDNQYSATTADRPFHVMVKPIGPTCNLECEYCYYLDKADLYPDQANFRIEDETLESFIRQNIESQPGSAVTFAWQGGEPTLLGIDFFRKVVEFQQKYAPADMHVQNSLQTNGTLLDEEWGEFLAEHDFLVGISLDGPEPLHNRFRRTRNDSVTFRQVMNGLSLLQEHDVKYNVLCVVNAINSHHPLDVYRFFIDQGIEWIQFIPLVEPLDGSEENPPTENVSQGEASMQYDAESDHQIPDWVRARGGGVKQQDEDHKAVIEAAQTAPISHRSVDPVVYGEFLCTIFDEWVRNDVGSISVRLFDQCLEILLRGAASLCVFSQTCGSQLAMEHNGDVYACDHFVDPGFERGNIHNMHLATLVDDSRQRQFGEYKQNGLPARCTSCNVHEFCHGGCPKNWHLQTPTGESGLNYLCAGYRRFFTYVQPYLECFERTIERNLPLPFVMDRVNVLDERRQ